jgi:predicted phosphodiesterase
MRVQIFSDLHCDVRAHKPIAVGRDVDAVVAAGDIAEGAENAFVALRRIVPEAVPAVFVMGNHEYYRRFFDEELRFARAIAPNFNVRLLECDTTIIGGVRFAGASLWTDYGIFGDHNAPAAMHAARFGMNDHRLIGWRRDPWARFRPQEALMIHASSRAFFKATLAAPFDGPSIAVSHHGHLLSVAERYKSDILTGAFASDIGELFATQADPDADADIAAFDLWIHGHVHDSADYRVGRTRVIVNPHGYGAENARFDPSPVVEVGT